MPDQVHKMDGAHDKFDFSSYGGDNSHLIGNTSRISVGGVSIILRPGERNPLNQTNASLGGISAIRGM